MVRQRLEIERSLGRVQVGVRGRRRQIGSQIEVKLTSNIPQLEVIFGFLGSDMEVSLRRMEGQMLVEIFIKSIRKPNFTSKVMR